MSVGLKKSKFALQKARQIGDPYMIGVAKNMYRKKLRKQKQIEMEKQFVQEVERQQEEQKQKESSKKTSKKVSNQSGDEQ